MLDIEVTFECSSNAQDDWVMSVKVPATSSVPMLEGNLRPSASITSSLRRDGSPRAFAPGKYMWIEDLFHIVEQCASTQVFAVLKRPDEKWVTEAAYDNPKFVEDIVRDLAVALDGEDKSVWYQVTSENFESIRPITMRMRSWRRTSGRCEAAVALGIASLPPGEGGRYATPGERRWRTGDLPNLKMYFTGRFYLLFRPPRPPLLGEKRLPHSFVQPRSFHPGSLVGHAPSPGRGTGHPLPEGEGQCVSPSNLASP